MKKLSIFLMLLSMLTAPFAAQASSDQPEYLKGATITVTLKNGKTYTFSADEYKVVARRSDAVVLETKRLARKAQDSTKIRLLGGMGPTALRATTAGNSTTISQDYGAVFGLGIEGKVDEHLSLGMELLSNKSALISVGVDL